MGIVLIAWLFFVTINCSWITDMSDYSQLFMTILLIIVMKLPNTFELIINHIIQH